MKKWMFISLVCLTACGQQSGRHPSDATIVSPPAQQSPINVVPSPSPSESPIISSYQRPPSGQIVWDIQLSASDVEINQQLEQFGHFSLPKDLQYLEVDGFEIKASTVARLKKRGIYTACYINAGSYESYRPDSSQYPKSLFIKKDPNWPDEYFLDITEVFKPNSILAKILKNRLAMCKQKGFDAVDPDNMQNYENTRGFITLQQQLDFNTWLADQAHAIGLAIIQKNGPDLIHLKNSQGEKILDKFDGILNESCALYDECSPLEAYATQNKLVMTVEYTSNSFQCQLARRYQLNMIWRDLNLLSPYQAGYLRQDCG